MESTPLKRLMWCLPWITVLLGLDQASKVWARTTLAGTPPREYWGVLRLTYAENPGAWGSFGAVWSPMMRSVVLAWLPALLLLGLFLYMLSDSRLGRLELVCLSGVVAGGIGNLIDRFRFGHVIDFLYLGYGPIGTNIFNIADMVLLAGIIVLFFKSFRSDPDSSPEPEAG
jgi:signal peptidase II